MKLYRKRKHKRPPRTGLVINWEFHSQNRWVCALTPYLVEALVEEFDPVIISSQEAYDKYKHDVGYVFSFEPGWAAPWIEFDKRIPAVKAVSYSDPHSRIKERVRYFKKNGFTYVFSYYYHPFFYHFKRFPKSRFVHMPWSIPEKFVAKDEIKCRGNEVAIFGGRASRAYDIRNWCRERECVTNYENSGVENKKMSDAEYFRWLGGFDAVVAAGSSLAKYDLVTPKYFEIAAAGALLFAQDCKDLEILGFDDTNCVRFTKENFEEKVRKYQSCPEAYLEVRKRGRDLIRERYTIDKKIEKIKQLFISSPY